MTGTHPNGIGTYVAAAAILKGQPVKFSDGKATPCTAATDAAFGIALDDASAGSLAPVAILGAYAGTVEMRATAAVSQGDAVTPAGAAYADSGKKIGLALTAAAASGDLFEIAHALAL